MAVTLHPISACVSVFIRDCFRNQVIMPARGAFPESSNLVRGLEVHHIGETVQRHAIQSGFTFKTMAPHHLRTKNGEYGTINADGYIDG
jgi:hypothetical protein